MFYNSTPRNGYTETVDENFTAGDSAREDCEFILDSFGLQKSYGDMPALCGATLRIPRGKIIGLLGPNGSGKTTFMKIAAGLLKKDGGEIKIDGFEVGVNSKSVVSYLPERNSIPEHFTVGEAIDFYSDFFPDFDRERAEMMIDSLLIKKAQKIKTLSKGAREKVQLVLVMSRRAKLYLLDEPISGVDPATRDFILGTVVRNFDPSSSIIISTHLISEIEKIMDSFVFLKEGRVYCTDTPSAIWERRGISVDEYFREVFRC